MAAIRYGRLLTLVRDQPLVINNLLSPTSIGTEFADKVRTLSL